VFFGVAVEVAPAIWGYLLEVWDFQRGTIHPPERPSRLKFALEVVGSALVALGVFGELVVGIKMAKVETDMRNETAELVAIVDERAGRLEPRHVTVDQRRRMLEILTSRNGTKVVIQPIVSEEGGDAFGFSREIAEVFHDARGTNWDADNPWQLVTMDIPLHGFQVELPNDSPENKELAAVVQSALQVLDKRVKQYTPRGNFAVRALTVDVGGK
jgi:hypothetical protein